MPHPEEHVNYLSSEENRPNVGTGVNCLEPKVTGGTKEQDIGLTNPEDVHSTEGYL